MIKEALLDTIVTFFKVLPIAIGATGFLVFFGMKLSEAFRKWISEDD